MDVYFLATAVLLPKECVHCQVSATPYQPEPDKLTPPEPNTNPSASRKKPHAGA